MIVVIFPEPAVELTIPPDATALELGARPTGRGLLVVHFHRLDVTGRGRLAPGATGEGLPVVGSTGEG